MFPPKQSDELLFHYNPYQEDSIQQDLILGQASVDGQYLTNKRGKAGQHKILATAKSNDGNINNIVQKKIVRKEIERQRRQHMTMLHDSLRSLLPLESTKGKRAVCDHVNAAVNYIKYLKKNIQDLSLKRDKLKNSSDSKNLDQEIPSLENCLSNCVTVHPCSGGVGIVIRSVLRMKNLLLSKVLKTVLEEGLDVVCCFSTQTDEGFLYSIQTEVCNLTCLDLHGLQQKLNNVT